MIYQIGKNPEYTFTMCLTANTYNGTLGLPLSISWWNNVDSVDNRNVAVAVTFLCFHFGVDIWKWKK